MGALGDVVKSLDNAPQITEQQKQSLDDLQQKADEQTAFYINQIKLNLLAAGGTTDTSIPVKSTVGTTSESHAYASSSADNIPNAIGSALKKFIDSDGDADKIVDGIISLLTDAITTLFGESDSKGSDFNNYYIAIDNDSLVRLDVSGWAQKVDVTAITNQIEQISSFVAYKSLVNMDKCDFETFFYAYDPIIKVENPGSTIEDRRAKGQALYDAFKKSDKSAVKAALAM